MQGVVLTGVRLCGACRAEGGRRETGILLSPDITADNIFAFEFVGAEFWRPSYFVHIVETVLRIDSTVAITGGGDDGSVVLVDDRTCSDSSRVHILLGRPLEVKAVVLVISRHITLSHQLRSAVGIVETLTICSDLLINQSRGFEGPHQAGRCLGVGIDICCHILAGTDSRGP